MDDLQIGEQRPSQLFRRMAEAGKNAGVALSTVKMLWLRRLPTPVRTALVAHEQLDAEKLGAIADKVHQTIKQGVIAEVKEEAKDSNLIHETKRMTENFEQLRGEVQQIRSQERTRTNWSAGRGATTSFRPPQQRQRRRLCAYHQRFEKFARNCQQPCDWRSRPPPPPLSVISGKVQRVGKDNRKTKTDAPCSGSGGRVVFRQPPPVHPRSKKRHIIPSRHRRKRIRNTRKQGHGTISPSRPTSPIHPALAMTGETTPRRMRVRNRTSPRLRVRPSHKEQATQHFLQAEAFWQQFKAQ
ncbi:unnamed protein product [Arctia plantaginis]|uniref:Uncharacterized protein n=1 Tax=Arctia plantaginis TaxID=874455 RepID=A0A8S0ZHD1_ARCPL|nr:unnamed protein product [Arctia plantaginis]